MTSDCSWCGKRLDATDCWLLADPADDRGAAFCRLEHIVPWSIRGPRWDSGAPAVAAEPEACTRCGAALGEDRLVLVHQRAGLELPDGFCGLDHLVAWAKAGGPWGGRPG